MSDSASISTLPNAYAGEEGLTPDWDRMIDSIIAAMHGAGPTELLAISIGLLVSLVEQTTSQEQADQLLDFAESRVKELRLMHLPTHGNA
jgi:hypothetical protein